MMNDKRKLTRIAWARRLLSAIVCLAILLQVSFVSAQNNVLTEQAVLKSIVHGQKALITRQGANGA